MYKKISAIVMLLVMLLQVLGGVSVVQAGAPYEKFSKEKQERIQWMYKVLVQDKGYHDAAACGLLGNVDQEVAFAPEEEQNNDEDHKGWLQMTDKENGKVVTREGSWSHCVAWLRKKVGNNNITGNELCYWPLYMDYVERHKWLGDRARWCNGQMGYDRYRGLTGAGKVRLASDAFMFAIEGCIGGKESIEDPSGVKELFKVDPKKQPKNYAKITRGIWENARQRREYSESIYKGVSGLDLSQVKEPAGVVAGVQVSQGATTDINGSSGEVLDSEGNVLESGTVFKTVGGSYGVVDTYGQGVLFKELVIEYLSEEDLDDDMYMGVHSWGEQIEAQDGNIFRYVRQMISFVAILLIVYAIGFYICYWIDIFNNIIDIELLPFITFGKMRVCPYGEKAGLTDGGKVRLMTHRMVLFRGLLAIGISVSILQGYLYVYVFNIMRFVVERLG